MESREPRFETADNVHVQEDDHDGGFNWSNMPANGSFWNVQSHFGFPSWPGSTENSDSLQIEVIKVYIIASKMELDQVLCV